MRVDRPKAYFDSDNPLWPDQVEIPIVMPDVMLEACGSEDNCRAVLQQELDRLVHKVDKAHKAHNGNVHEALGYAGAKRVLRTHHSRRASSYERFGSLVPNFAAAGDPEVAETSSRSAARSSANIAKPCWRGAKATEKSSSPTAPGRCASPTAPAARWSG